MLRPARIRGIYADAPESYATIYAACDYRSIALDNHGARAEEILMSRKGRTPVAAAYR
jgi:hypothetical protein